MNLNFFKDDSSDKEKDESANLHTEPSMYEGSYTYKKYGFLQSKSHSADPIALQVELKKIMEGYRDRVRRDEQEQEKMKLPVRKRIEAWKTEKEKIERDLQKVKEQEIPALHQKIQKEREDITSIRKNPEQYRKEKPNKLSFYFGWVVFALLTVYLWIFYTSASYSAFFRNFQADDINVARSIFDAQALSKAYTDGIPAFVLVTSMPFIFLALGFLIHKYMEKEDWSKYVALPLLILVTFGFDYIIAFEIVKKVYDLKVANSLQDLPPYNMQMAFYDINFWLIIFAGFVTYLIWGFLFDKLMVMYDQFDVVKAQVRIREKEIKTLQKAIKEKEKELKVLENKCHEVDKQLAEGAKELEATFFKPKEFEHVIYQFGSGWMQYIEGGLIMSEDRKKALRQETKQVIENFIQENNKGVFYERA
ncbi:MAG: transforming acidic coiled-coil-containing protein [Bacteroidota bacterium]|nr:transforming acidic coiled-coil-containing protein [Bacteroidota bacterium]